MTRPADLPEWADGGSALVTTPTSGKKAIGWVPGERPAAQYLNYLFLRAYQWLSYFNAFLNSGEMAVTMSCGGAAGVSTSGLPLFVKSTGAYLFTSDAIPLPVGARINFYRIRVSKAGSSSIAITLNKYATNVGITLGAPAPANIDSNTVTGTGIQDSTIAVASPVAIATGEKWYLQVQGTDTGDITMHLSVFWDTP